MAMALDAFASYLGDLLKKTAEEEIGMLFSVPAEIIKLNDTLTGLKKFLADAERKNITDESAQYWVMKLKDAMYEATDIADLVQIKAKERRASMETSPSCLSSFLFSLQDPLFAHKIGSRIKALNQKMDGILKQAPQLNFIANIGCFDDRKVINNKTAPGIVHGDAIGVKIEQDTRMLVDKLTKEEMPGEGESNRVHVLAILGTGGIGKTTIAKKVFSDQTVHDSFDTMIWLSVTRDFTEVDLLRTAIIDAGGDHHGAQEKSVLEPILTRALRGKKFLLVMDDMWTAKPWGEVLRVPAVEAGAPGSKVLITTRNEGVAREMNAVHMHHVSKLGLQDAWAMLKKKVALSELENERLKDIGMKIVEKCDGLPLAIKVVAGVLLKKDRTENDWKELLENHIWSKMGLPEELNKAIYLSYEDLNPSLKQCFLYYSLFPKDEIIGVDKVVAMWTAEGFLGYDGSSTKLGKCYYKELIMRNLLEPQDNYYNQEHCIMHDVICSFAQYVARDEARVVRSTQHIKNLTSSNFRRLSVSANEIEWNDIQKQHSLRTLLLFGNIKFKPSDSLRSLPCLRTIHVRDAHFATMIGSLCHLKHLRYLELRYTNISALPQNIGRMKLLEHVGLRGCHSLAKLPSSIIELENLRYLDIDETKINAIPGGFGRLKNLEMLWGFPVHVIVEGTAVHSCSLEEIGPLLQLRKLQLKGIQNVSSSSMATAAELKTKTDLICLELWCTDRLTTNANLEVVMVEQRWIKDVFDELCPPPCLEELTIRGYFGNMLPSWVMEPTTFLQNLRRLDLQDLAYCMYLPAGLGQAPHLDCFVVNCAPHIEQIGYEFFFREGKKYIDNKRNPSHPAFPKLHELYLQGMTEWKEWTWEKHVEAMPILSVLHIRNCKLKHLPIGLAYQAKALKRLSIASVQHLKSVENCSSVVKLDAYDNPDLVKIASLPNMQSLTIVRCPNLKLLDGVGSLRSIQLGDNGMETLPGYLQHIKLQQLEFACSLKLLRLMSNRDSSEWEKINHIIHVKGFASENGDSWRWYVSYTRDPYTFETNIQTAFTECRGTGEFEFAVRYKGRKDQC
ncbi:hypothetical protein ACP4OV_003619 [Aristida adscensionis]